MRVAGTKCRCTPERLSLIILLSALLFVSTVLTATVLGDVYEFTFKGEVTSIFPGQNVEVGDPATIRFLVDSVDVNPHPIGGRYLAWATSIVLPNTSFYHVGPPTEIRVSAPSDTTQFFTYMPNVQSTNIPFTHLFDLHFAFPTGTFADDSLPLELPLQVAFVKQFSVGVGTDLFRGTVTSQSSALVPEPSISALIAIFACIALRRQPNNR